MQSANEFQTQRESLLLKLQVSQSVSESVSQSVCDSLVTQTSPLSTPPASLQETESRNRTLESRLGELEQRLESSLQERQLFRSSLRSLLELLDTKILELTELRDALARILEGGGGGGGCSSS